MFDNSLIFLKRSFSKVETIKKYLIYTLAIVFPVNQKISTILLIITGIVSLLDFKKKDIPAFFKLILPMVLLYLVYVISYARDGLGFDTYWLEKKATLIIFPLIFFDTDLSLKKDVLKLFVYGCVINYLLCMIVALYTSFNGYEFNFINEIPNKELGLTEAIDYNANKLLGSAFITTGFQRSYLAIYFSFALFIVWLGLREKKLVVRILISVLLIAGILQTWSLAGILSLFITAITLIFMKIKKRRLQLLFFVIAAISLASVVNFNNRAKFMYDTIAAGNLKIDGPTASTVRLRPWIASIDKIKKNPIWGYGMKNAQKELNNFYKSNIKDFPRFKLALDKKFNAHNQYFQFILESGIIAILLFILIVIYHIFNINQHTISLKFIGVGFLILIVFNFLFESMMNRYMGISFIALFWSLFLPVRNKNIIKNE